MLNLLAQVIVKGVVHRVNYDLLIEVRKLVEELCGWLMNLRPLLPVPIIEIGLPFHEMDEKYGSYVEGSRFIGKRIFLLLGEVAWSEDILVFAFIQESGNREVSTWQWKPQHMRITNGSCHFLVLRVTGGWRHQAFRFLMLWSWLCAPYTVLSNKTAKLFECRYWSTLVPFSLNKLLNSVVLLVTSPWYFFWTW